MKLFKDFKKEYKDYSIEVFGKPLDTPTIPFTFLPKDKTLDECEIIDYKIIEKEFTQTGVSFKTMKPIKPKKMKGHILVYVR